MGVPPASDTLDDCRSWLTKKNEEGYSWEWLLNLGEGADGAEQRFYTTKGERGWNRKLDYESYQKLVEYEHARQGKLVDSTPMGIAETDFDNRFVPKTTVNSSWYMYEKRVLRKYMDEVSVANVRMDANWILNRLRLDTRESGPNKGLVVGSVQSGKTASMAALITMAADEKFNFFIVLSGTIDSLRVQTRDRLRHDLQLSNSSLTWRVIDFPTDDKKTLPDDLELSSLNGTDCGKRYATVCLKQPDRLRKLIDWLYENPNRANRLRILVIDDEADQASIDTRVIETDENDDEIDHQQRSIINGLITRLANGKTSEGLMPKGKIQGINYVSYTATPYANVLNETSEESLYPKDFIYNLHESKNYIGVEDYFIGEQNPDGAGGDPPEPLDVIRIIPEEEITESRRLIKKTGSCVAGESLQDALCWFICMVAARHVGGPKAKELSMLVHTSARTEDHRAVFAAIKRYLKNKDVVVKRCKHVYKREVTAFTKADFAKSIPGYGRLDEMQDEFPPFKDIKPEIKKLLNEITTIKEDSDRKLVYSEGIHLCLDNSSAQMYAPENTHYRITYPDSLEGLDKDPAFIVIGGNTLSRGLTLRGLICTYFERNTNQADSLMQMGRWFGYPSGYELGMRIWMSEATMLKFQVLARVNEDLKTEIKNYVDEGMKPSDFGPRITAVPSIARLRPTAKNKMQRAESGDFDFNGWPMETTQYLISDLQANAICVNQLIDKMSESPRTSDSAHAIFWNHVSYQEIIKPFLNGFAAAEGDQTSQYLPQFMKWLDAVNANEKLKFWNIACAGKAPSPGATWDIKGTTSVGKVRRTRKKQAQEGVLSLGSLRNARDALCDIEDDRKGNMMGDYCISRAKLGYGDIPLLLLYCIDKNTPATKSHPALNAPCDVYGYSIIVPGGGRYAGAVASYRVKKRKKRESVEAVARLEDVDG